MILIARPEDTSGASEGQRMDTIGNLRVSVNDLVDSTEALNRVRLGTEEACRMLQQSIDRRFAEIERLLIELETEMKKR